MWAIVLPIAALPLLITLFLRDRKAKKELPMATTVPRIL